MAKKTHSCKTEDRLAKIEEQIAKLCETVQGLINIPEPKYEAAIGLTKFGNHMLWGFAIQTPNRPTVIRFSLAKTYISLEDICTGACAAFVEASRQIIPANKSVDVYLNHPEESCWNKAQLPKGFVIKNNIQDSTTYAELYDAFTRFQNTQPSE